MNLKRVRSLMLCVLPISLPLFAACSAAGDVDAEGTDPGDGTVGVSTQAVTATAVSTVGASTWASFALSPDGTVWSTGDNTEGELGVGALPSSSSLPVGVSGLTGVAAVAASRTSGENDDSSHAYALAADGTVWAWGFNNFGQLGDGTTTVRRTPVQVSGLSGVTAVATADYHGLAVASDGTAWAWGNNQYGRLGDGTTTQRLTPVQVSGLSGITAVVGGFDDSYALKSDGTLWAWGHNSHGELGDGTTTERDTPVQIGGLSGVTAVAAGYKFLVALKLDGTVWTAGWCNSGRLGTGASSDQHTPVHVSGLSGVTAVGAGQTHAFAVASNGTLWAWGLNDHGQLGDGTTTEQDTPVQISGLSGIVSVTGGTSHSIAMSADGTVWAWGLNDHGQLGIGTTAEQHSPVPSKLDGGATWPMPNPVSTGLPNPASYTSATGYVTDNVTGLQWEQPAMGCASGCDQADAAAYCASLGLAGYSDWRLPTRIELVSIVDDTQHFAAIDPNAFPGTSNSYFKTSSVSIDRPNAAFAIGGAEGDTADRSVTGAVDTARCVRGSAEAASQYVIPSGGTVLDARTGLTWQQAVPAQTYDWSDAASQCAAIGAGWRLPSMKELQTIVDESQASPMIDPTAFPSTPIDVGYWTSTSVAWQPGYAWYVTFDSNNKSNHDAVGATYHVRCVH